MTIQPRLPSLTLQTGTLYASGLDDTFAGSGGPWGWSSFTGQFGGVVNSAGLDGAPFADTVTNVSPGDNLVFVVAVQNRGTGSAYDVRVRATAPAGFVPPPGGSGITVTDGAGRLLPSSGDLFGVAGLLIGAPLTGYDANSGANVALISYALMAGPSTPGPYATVLNGASVTNVAASEGGADVAAAHPADAAATVITSAPTPIVTAEGDPSALAVGQAITFDVTLAIPSGTVNDLRLDLVLPPGAASLSLVSSSVLAMGAGLRSGAPQVTASGSIAFGTVTSSGVAGSDAITMRVTVQANGTASGPATLDAVISAASAAAPGGRWTASVASTVGVVAPPVPPQLSGIWTAQHATQTMNVHPFGGFTVTDANANGSGTATLAVTLQDGSLGRLSGAGLGSFDAAGDTFFTTGSLAAVQAAARALVFTPAQTGTEGLNVTLVDSAGGVAQDSGTSVAIAASADTAQAAQHFAPATGASFLTATADGQQTLVEGETYAGPVGYLEAQYIYDGTQPVAIVAETPNVFVKNFVGDAAVQVSSGQNVIDAGKGSNFLVGGTGNDVFYLDGRTNAVTWDTIVGFHAGDIATLWGFTPGVSRDWWEDDAGAPGYTGRTLRIDMPGSGGITGSITFAGMDQATTDRFALTTGQIGGTNYMTIFSL